MVFAKTQINSPYLLYTMSPRCLISPDCTTVVSQLDLNGSVLVIEENEDAPDPLMLFEEVLTDQCIHVAFILIIQDVRGCFSTDLTTPIEIGRRIRESGKYNKISCQQLLNGLCNVMKPYNVVVNKLHNICNVHNNYVHFTNLQNVVRLLNIT